MTSLLGEFIGTALLVLLGNGVVASVILARSKALGGGWLLITVGWAMAVFIAVFCVAPYNSGAHLNPAVTVALAMTGRFPWAEVLPYIGVQTVGAAFGALLVWAAYYKQFGETEDAGTKLAAFSTGPAVRNLPANIISEAVASFVLVFGILQLASASIGLGALDALPVALLVMGIGASLGGATGFAINPARDLGPRILHALLPIQGKQGSNWSYAWVPVVGPLVGGALAALLYQVHI
ncbi:MULTISPECIES: MIP/aquaporin family protein [Pseudomonas]|jgi:glycerol uptake facilitator protein|uniref:Aquaporin family protein n=2 Tax=Pseudomonas TaxID=286 RepID=A0A7Y8G6K2_9PSED|nr:MULTISPECIES: MIP/aquaporin family protein [Pseudomonas]MBX9410506.1 aquaporin family protein [Pseudomonas baetica]MCT8950376.1 aquaporin family protein [Pseudomonas iridis]MCU9532478.1 aquaporin family protein [Pseudomonas mosselii]MCU9539803.1 aquaporin family protein [Pseudomonas mosselii]MCU9551337.1 aquaporin family protein [Pseudomonas mosselii]